MSPSVEPFNEARYKALMDGLECSEVNLKNAMMSSYSSRLDSDFFKKDAIEFSRISKEWEIISAICPNIKSGTTPSIRDENIREGIALLKTNDIRNNIINPLSKEQFFYIDKQTNETMKSTVVKSKDVLINIVGASTDVVGRVSFIPDKFIKANITQAMALLRIENTSYLPEYLFVFLLSTYAKRQTNRISRQTGQYNMNLKEVGTYRIWKPSIEFQLKIAEIVNISNINQTNAKKLYQESQKIIAKLLPIPADRFKQNISIKSMASSYKTFARLDAEYYQAKYDELFSVIEQFDTTTIPDEFDVYKNFGTGYADGISDVGVIKTKQLTNDSINCDGVESFLDNETCIKNKSTYLINGDVVFASMGVGSLGKVSLFTYGGDKRFVTDSTLRIYRSKPTSNVKAEVLCVFLQSKVGQELIYRYIVGSTGIINIYDTDIAKIPIPVLDSAVQEQITDKVQESFFLRHKSEQLLEHAKQAVEIAIEEGDKKAMEWLKEKGIDC